MRISDWSSDVCSSDLPPPPSLSAQPPSVLASQGRRGDGGRLASLPFGRHQRTEDTETLSMTLRTNAPGTRPRSAGLLGPRGAKPHTSPQLTEHLCRHPTQRKQALEGKGSSGAWTP